MAQHYKHLVAWQKAIDLVSQVYLLTNRFPKHELTASRTKFDALLFQSQATLPKDKRISAGENSRISSAMPVDPWPK